MKICKYESKYHDDVVKVCIQDKEPSHPEELWTYIELMFCYYYIEKEPENCFILLDEEKDKVVGYIYGAADYDTYHKNHTEYLERIAELKDGVYLTDGQIEMYNHFIYKDKYPAHLHIDINPAYQSMGYGSKLIKEFLNHMKNKGVNGVMLIVGTENEGARRFYERNGFELLAVNPGGAAYGISI